MFVYAIATISLIIKTVWHIKESENKEFAKSAGYADNLFGTRKKCGISSKNEGPQYDYFQEEKKTCVDS